MPEHDEPTQLLPQHFHTMQEGYDDPAEVMAVQRFMLRVGGPTIAMKLLPGGANGKFDQRMTKALEAYQEKFGIETPNKGKLDATTSISMNELRGELSAQDRRPDVMEHLLSQMPQRPKHHLETSEGPQAELRSAQLHALDAVKGMKAQKPDKHVTEFIQEVLASRGYPLGPTGIDGKPGKFTMAALQDYQRDAGLMPIGFLKDGSLDPATLEMMRMDDTQLEQKKAFQQPRIDLPASSPRQGQASISGLSGLADALKPAAGPPAIAESHVTPVVADAAPAARELAEPADAVAKPNRPPSDRSRESMPLSKFKERDYHVPSTGGGLFSGNISIEVGQVAERGLFGRTVSPGIKIKIF